MKQKSLAYPGEPEVSSPAKKKVFVIAEQPERITQFDWNRLNNEAIADPVLRRLDITANKLHDDYWAAVTEYDNYRRGYFDYNNGEQDQAEMYSPDNLKEWFNDPDAPKRLKQQAIRINLLDEERKKVFQTSNLYYRSKYNPTRYSLANPTGGKDNTFVTEAQNVKTFYSNNEPETKVEILPTYGEQDTTMLKDKMKQLSSDDLVYIFGHTGSKLAGIPNEKLASLMRRQGAKEVMLGTCNGAGNAVVCKPFTKNINKVTAPTNSWLGFNPKSKTPEEAMFSRQNVDGIGMPRIVNPKENKEYKIFKRN